MLEAQFAIDDAGRAAVHRLLIDPVDREALAVLQMLDAEDDE